MDALDRVHRRTGSLERLIHRHKTSFDEASKHFESRAEEFTSAPFVYLKSSSTGQRFPLFIGYSEKTEAVNQGFNSYGLSGKIVNKDNNTTIECEKSTVPIF